MPLILVIEDDTDIRSSLAEFLEAEGYLVAQAPDCASALTVLRAARPDAIILDYALPGIADGAGFLVEKAKIGELASVPVIVTSGFPLSPDLEGAAAILTKPFDLDRLLEVIRRLASVPDASTAA
jgi:DNA-binding response OmpR family regulator